MGIPLFRKAIALDPFHPTWFNFPDARYHFDRKEYKEALAAVQKVDLPGHFWLPVFLAAIYAELGRQSDAQAALEELRKLYPGFAIENLIDEARKWNATDDKIRNLVKALRKAGLAEGTEA
jgi:tetratricopeptide (TPR) repeat protein